MGSHPSLSIVVPVFNEPEWIGRSLQRVAEAALASRWSSPEIVVVDDGSTDQTGQELQQLDSPLPLRILRQPNSGRFLARRAGIDAAKGEYVLLLDARVLIGNGLDDLVDRVTEGKTVWTSDCEVATQDSLLATFWDVPPRIFWSAYFSHPRMLSFGIQDFHKYPKGTTCFLAPRDVLLTAYEAFSSRYSDLRQANDDTHLIEQIARDHRIWISPEFACRYEPRHNVRRFLPHAFHRGVVFVDGFLRPGNPFAPAILAFYTGSLALTLAAPRRKWVVPAGYAAITTLAVAAALTRHLPRRHLAAIAVVTPLFVTGYGAGMWAGLALALRTWVRARLRP